MSKLFKFGLGFLLIGLAVVLIVSTTTSADLFVVDDENYTFYEKDYEFDELSSFYLDFDNRNVNILESEDNKVHLKYYIHDKDLVEYEVSEKELNFTISRKWYYNIFSFDIFSSKEYFKVYLYIPSGMNITVSPHNLPTGFSPSPVTRVRNLGAIAIAALSLYFLMKDIRQSL